MPASTGHWGITLEEFPLHEYRRTGDPLFLMMFLSCIGRHVSLALTGKGIIGITYKSDSRGGLILPSSSRLRLFQLNTIISIGTVNIFFFFFLSSQYSRAGYSLARL